MIKSIFRERGMEGVGKLLPLMALALVAASLLIGSVEGAVYVPPKGLTRKYYKKTNSCAPVEEFIKHQVKLFWARDKTITAKLLRLTYSDCMVSGCDGSILLDGADSERKAPQNVGLGGFLFIDKVKEVVEKYCPGVVSCADILQLATRDAVALAGGPSYIVLTGRRDGVTSKASSVDLPSPNISHEEGLDYFESRGLNVLDMTTLLGAHSMGKARCRYLRPRLYNFQGTGKADPSIGSSTLEELKKQCPKTQKKGEHEGLVYLNKDSGDSYSFTNSYYKNIQAHKAVLEIDQQLLFGNETQQITEQFANPDAGMQDFKKSFALAMVRMGSYKVLTGSQGQIRKHCQFTN